MSWFKRRDPQQVAPLPVADRTTLNLNLGVDVVHVPDDLSQIFSEQVRSILERACDDIQMKAVAITTKKGSFLSGRVQNCLRRRGLAMLVVTDAEKAETVRLLGSRATFVNGAPFADDAVIVATPTEAQHLFVKTEARGAEKKKRGAK